MRIMACDLATNVGHCVGDTDGEPRFGTKTLPSTGEDIGRFAVAYDQWLRDMIALESPDRLVFEAPIISFGKTTLSTARKLMGLSWHTEFVCGQLGVACIETNVSTIKLFFAGSGRAGKTEMIRMAQRYGWNVRNDNEADACAIWASAVHAYAPQHAARFRMGPIGAKAVPA